MTTWHWVRHGPTHAKNFVGWRDVPADLSDVAQIARLRRTLPPRAILVSSDLERARTTADAIARPSHTRMAHDPHLREMHFGRWDGLHFDAVADKDPELSRAFWEQPGDISAPGGESWNDASARVDAAVRRMGTRHAGAHIIVVAHFGVILTQLQRALDVTPYQALAQRIDNFSVTSIHAGQGAPEVTRINQLP
ncbi:MAG: histidine phosphatase family protein [Roseobacter sp.]